MRTELWCKQGYRMQKVLYHAHGLRVSKNMQGKHSLSFTLPVDEDYEWLKHRKIIRLINKTENISTAISAGSSLSYLIVSDVSQFSLLDYVIVNDKRIGVVSDRVSSHVAPNLYVDNVSQFSTGSYYYVEDDNDGEVFKVTSKGSNYLVCSLENTYDTGASITTPGRCYVARIEKIVGNNLYLSTIPYTSSTDSQVKKVDFTTYRIKEIVDTFADTHQVSVVCDYIGNDLIDDIYLVDGRSDVGYTTSGLLTNVAQTVDIDTIADSLLSQSSDFSKGDLLRNIYSTGTVNVTNGSATITGNSVDWTYISSGSIFVVDGDSTEYIVGYAAPSLLDPTTIKLTTDITRDTDTELDYYILSKGIHTEEDIIGMCDVSEDSKNVTDIREIDGITPLKVSDGRVVNGAVFKLAGYAEEYRVDAVQGDYEFRLTEEVSSDGTDVNFVVMRDSREISFSNETVLSGLKKVTDTWTDSTQHIWIDVREDKLVDIYRKPLPDDRDPTSDLMIEYRENMKGVTRKHREHEFGNRLYVKGSASNWINAESGVSSTVQTRYIINYDTKAGGVFSVGNTITGGTSGATGVVVNEDYTGTAGILILNTIRGEYEVGEQISCGGVTADIERLDKENTKLQFAVGEPYKFRVGDPVQIWHKPVTVGIDSATKNTLSIDTDTQYVMFYNKSADAWVNYSGAAQNIADDDVYLPPGDGTVGDITYIGSTSKFSEVSIRMTTLGVGDWDNIWEYCDDAAPTWSKLVFTEQSLSTFIPHTDEYLVDTGTYTNKFTVPDNWVETTINSVEAYWIRVRTGKVDGTHTGGNGETIRLIDSSKNFNIEGVEDGWLVTNVTDGGTGVVTGLTGTTQVNFSAGLTGGADNDFDNGDTYMLSALRTFTTAPKAGEVWAGRWKTNEFTGGFLLVSSGEGIGQIRAIASNTSDTITVSRDFDVIPFGATTKISSKVANTTIRGFGYTSLKIDYSNGAKVIRAIEGSRHGFDNAYYGGIIELTNEDHIETHEILISKDTADRFEIQTSSDMDRGATRMSVTGAHRLVKEYQTGTTYDSDGAGKARIAITEPNAPDTNMWNTGTMMITSDDVAGTKEPTGYEIATTAWVGNVLTLVMTQAWVGSTPESNDGVILCKETYLPLSIAEIEWIPEEGDECVLLLKEIGNMSIGKHFLRRCQIESGGRSFVWIATADASKFPIDSRVFIGSKTVTSAMIFNLRRGDQTQGQIAIVYDNTHESGSSTRIEFAKNITTEEVLDTSPQPNDHLELLTIQDDDSITAEKKALELHYDRSDILNPRLLYTYAEKFLDDAISYIPDYTVDFLDLQDYAEYKYSDYVLGDTVTLVDRFFSIDANDIRIISVDYSPGEAYNKKVTFSKYKLPSGDKIYDRLLYQGAMINKLASKDEGSKCVFYKKGSGQCMKKSPPNTFCNTSESNYDGTYTREGDKMGKVYCGSYTPKNSLDMGIDDAYTTMHEVNVVTITNTDWDSSVYETIPSDTTLSKDTKAVIVKVMDTTTGSELSITEGDVRILRYSNDVPIPSDTDTQTGCTLLLKTTTDSIGIDAIVLLVGKKN